MRILQVVPSYPPAYSFGGPPQVMFDLGKELVRRGHSVSVYTTDVVDALLLAAASEKADGQVFNLGGERPYTLLEFVQTLLKVCGSGSYKIVPFPEERKRIDIGSVYSSYSKIKKILNWSPKVSLEEGLKQTMGYFKRNRVYYW